MPIRIGQTPGIRRGLPQATGIRDPNSALEDPMSQRIQKLLQRRALRTASNARRRGSVLTGLAGLNPMQARGALLGVERGAAEDLSGSLNEATLSGLQRDQDWARRQEEGRLDFNRERELMELQERFMRERNKYGWLKDLGGLGARAGLAFATGGTSELAGAGARLGGGGGRASGGYDAEEEWRTGARRGGYRGEGRGGYGGIAGFDPYDEAGNELRRLRRQGYQWVPGEE